MEFSDKERRSFRSLSMADLYWFTRWMFVNRRGYTWQQAAHHIQVCEALTRVFNGECKRLIINIPPRYSKTEIVKNFIGWSLGHYPDCEFIYTSYSARLAAASSWDVRGLVQEPEYQAIFPGVQLRDDSKAKDEWRTSAGGIVYAVGSEGTITGYGAGKLRPGFGGALLIDDPHKADEARSDVMRQNVIDWFQNTFESRKNSPETPIILIMQRLHESDLAGWLLAGGNGEKWEHVCLPALRDDGTALWPEKHSVEELRRMEAAAPYTFAGQYQQRPSPAEGGLFKPDRIEVIDALPAGAHSFVRGWDLASVVNAGDWTAGPRIGKLPDGRYVIADMVRVQEGPDQRDSTMKATATRDGTGTKISIPQDPGQAGKTQVAYLTKMFAGYRIIATPESGDKVTRAEPFASQVNVGNVVMVRGPWNAALIDEMRMFPNGSFDDQVDGCSRAFAELIAKRASFFG
ncbi:phage terminase large subunit [Paraburkholderia panacisoli]|uniref:Phage terminase large subunit n=1 Tax=Paraburkholderia panacisoli TaxID=2603818 RepID=A0A5B0HCT9_9BURK|nr:phage terminase large subunit [Paraburkholderia panacisoli]KAA1013017.1 phage terminase large subunit [Paraburkholderia panacisoli]